MHDKQHITAFACFSSRKGEVKFKLDKYLLKKINKDLENAKTNLN